jgi:hypothetical protein
MLLKLQLGYIKCSGCNPSRESKQLNMRMVKVEYQMSVPFHSFRSSHPNLGRIPCMLLQLEYKISSGVGRGERNFFLSDSVLSRSRYDRRINQNLVYIL